MVQDKAQFDDRIRNLLALAEDNSAESRTLLFSHICDLFLQQRPMESDNQIRMLIEIINELIGDVDIGIRKELCDILLSIDNPPEELIKLMSEDVVEVSGRLLEVATIDDEQLLYLIKYASDEHRDHIGRRFGLTPLLRRELDEQVRSDQRIKEEVSELVALAETNKVSLHELEEAEQNSTELNEDVTANILEVLRSNKKHRATPEEPVIEEETVAEPEDDSEKISLISRILEKKMAESEPADDENAAEHISIAPIKVEDHDDDIEFEIPADLKHTGEPELQSANDQNDPDELILDQPAPQEGPTTLSDEWFWEIDRYGNIKYLSENAQSIFLQTPEDLSGEDFLCLWRRPDASDNDPNDFIALFEKRQPFRDERFDFEMAPGVFQSHLLSAIATFDLENGRFTGFRGSAHLSRAETDIYKIAQTNDNEVDQEKSGTTDEEQELILTSPLLEKIDKPEEATPRPEFSGNLLNELSAKDNRPSEELSDISLDHLREPYHQDEVASELLHNLSHEFRTPLNAIIGFSQMIDNEMWGPVSERYRKNTKDIINAANHLKEAVNNILDSAKLDAGLIEPSPESFSLKSVIQDALETISPILESKELVVSGIDDNIDVILYNDKHCIILCLIKIITFATKNADMGDELHLSVLVNSNAQVRIEIPLINHNISADKAEELFVKTYNLASSDSETSTDNSEFKTKIASGFGLSVAQDVAKLIGGSLSTMSENGKVSHVVLTISTYPA